LTETLINKIDQVSRFKKGKKKEKKRNPHRCSLEIKEDTR